MRKLEGRVAVVTGAAAGIGRAIAMELAQRGCQLALVDLDAAGLEESAATVHGLGRRVTTHVGDVSDRDWMSELPMAVFAEHSGVHILLNNAGVSVVGRFQEQTLDNFDWIMRVNLFGAIHACYGFLPHLLKEDEAHIANIASEFAFFGFPTKSAYCASKFALRGFTESLRAELTDSSVGVTCVYPGAVATDIVWHGRVVNEEKRKLEAEFLAKRAIPVDRAARAVVRAIQRNRSRCLIGRDAWLVDGMTRYWPNLVAWMVARLQKRLPFA